MAIDNALFISDMDINSPADVDDVAEGAGQIRAVKAAIKRTFPMLQEGQGANAFARMPLGGIITYSGTQEELDKTPEWALCDGRTVNSRQTPNLVDKFVMGGGIDKIGLNGGSNTRNTASGLSVNGHALSEAEMPSHSHGIKDGGNYPITSSGGWSLRAVGADEGIQSSRRGGNQPHSHGLSGSDVDNRPAYYTLAYIMFVGYTI